MKALIAIAVFIVAAAIVVVAAKYHQNVKATPVAVEPSSTVPAPMPVVHEPTPEPIVVTGAPPVQTQAAQPSATAEEVAGIYRRVIEKIEAAQPK